MQDNLSYLPQILMALGVGALIVEIAILGFATFILLFIGSSLFLTGFAMYLTWLPATINMAIWSNIIVTALLALTLWKPLKRLQNKTDHKPIESDFAQQMFVLNADINATSDTMQHHYSGINWKVRSLEPLNKGQTVKVVRTEVGVLWVEAVDS